jgi:hypothetical protein
MGALADFNADAGVVTVRESKAGKPRHVVLTAEGQKLFATLTAGKLASDPIFGRRDGGVWGKSQQSAQCWTPAIARRSSQPFPFTCLGIPMAQRWPCAGFRWVSLQNSSATLTLE